MASSKKSGGNSRLEKNVNGRRSSKLKEGPVGEFSSASPSFFFLVTSLFCFGFLSLLNCHLPLRRAVSSYVSWPPVAEMNN